MRPYFHDGSAKTLMDVVEHYDKVRNLRLTGSQKRALVQYLKSLSPIVRRTIVRRYILAALASGASAAPSLGAQRPIALRVAGGVSAPQGDLSDGADMGWHALGTLVLSSPMLPLGIRLDAAYNRFAFSDQSSTRLGEGGHQTVGSRDTELYLSLADDELTLLALPHLRAWGIPHALFDRPKLWLVNCVRLERRSRDETLCVRPAQLHRGSLSPHRAWLERHPRYFPLTFGLIF